LTYRAAGANSPLRLRDAPLIHGGSPSRDARRPRGPVPTAARRGPATSKTGVIDQAVGPIMATMHLVNDHGLGVPERVTDRPRPAAPRGIGVRPPSSARRNPR